MRFKVEDPGLHVPSVFHRDGPDRIPKSAVMAAPRVQRKSGSPSWRDWDTWTQKYWPASNFLKVTASTICGQRTQGHGRALRLRAKDMDHWAQEHTLARVCDPRDQWHPGILAGPVGDDLREAGSKKLRIHCGTVTVEKVHRGCPGSISHP